MNIVGKLILVVFMTFILNEIVKLIINKKR